MKINGEEQVNIGTEENPYWVPKNNPFPLKGIKEKQEFIESWANGVLDSDEGKKLEEKLNEEFLEYVVFGKTPYYANEKVLEELVDYTKTELNLSSSEIIERFSVYLLEEQLKRLKGEK